jgi:hypothetical protein
MRIESIKNWSKKLKLSGIASGGLGGGLPFLKKKITAKLIRAFEKKIVTILPFSIKNKTSPHPPPTTFKGLTTPLLDVGCVGNPNKNPRNPNQKKYINFCLDCRDFCFDFRVFSLGFQFALKLYQVGNFI